VVFDRLELLFAFQCPRSNFAIPRDPDLGIKISVSTNMSSLRRAAALLLMPAMGLAQDFDAGLSAATTGDYAVALREWTPLAEQATRVRNPISTKKL
jgi:hypothetical protein